MRYLVHKARAACLPAGRLTRWLWLPVLLWCLTEAGAQTNPAGVAGRQWRLQHERAIIDELTTFLSLPNVTSDRDAVARNAAALLEMMRARGITSQLLSVPGANPVVFGEIRTPGATTTIVFYAHYDGQPVEPKDWASPPFSPVMRAHAPDHRGPVLSLPPQGQALDPEARIYARSASDDKGTIIALLSAVDAIKAAGLPLRSTIKLVFDGEEEIGSPNLEKIVAANKGLFSGNVWLICDGSQYPGNRPLVTFGARGFVGTEVTVYGPRRELHSGNFGNWAPNPALTLARLLASLKDDNGRVLVKGFYDGIVALSAAEKRALRDVPPTERELMNELWLGSTEGAPATLNERLALPSLNIHGLASARVGPQRSSIIPSRATASIDMRLVKGMDYRQTFRRLTDHVREQGFFVVDTEPDANILRAHPRVAKVTLTAGSNAMRTPMDVPIAQAVIRAVESVRGPVLKLPTMGGSLPLELIERTLGAHTINIHMSNPDNNNHSFDENLRLQNLWDGIEQAAALLLMDAPIAK
jgi:acetylornithine deacetylase/succinyl-diaminopimelate desuccinylase-like protein